MNEGEEHNELIHQLAERLRNHTEPYKDGAWERFAATYGKRRRRLWPYWSAAAVLLAGVGLYWSTHDLNETFTPIRIAQQDAVPQAVEPAERKEDAVDKLLPKAVVDSSVQLADHAAPQRVLSHDVEQQRYAGAGISVSEAVSVKDTLGTRSIVDDEPTLSVAAVDTSRTPDPMPHRVAAVVERKADEQSTGSTPANMAPYKEAANRDAYAMAPSNAEAGMERWDLGIVVSPSLTSESVNIGGGFAVAYQISDKFSIGSGISVAQLGVGENPNYQPGSNALRQQMAPSHPTNSFNGESAAAVDYKREVSVTSSVVALDIPLDLRYEVANGFYTSLGLSYVTVLDERRTSHVIDRLNKNTFANGQPSSADRLTSTEFVYSSEKIADKPLRGNGYAGFMNFSIGKKLPVSSKLSLSIEPYFKLPIGRLSKEEMNFTNGGIRIVTGF